MELKIKTAELKQISSDITNTKEEIDTLIYDKFLQIVKKNYIVYDKLDFSSREEAIEAVKEDYGVGYVGRCVRLKFDERDITYDETGYYLEQTLYYEVGDAADDWEMTDEQEIELSKILAKDVIKYIHEHNLQPNCYKVINIEEVEGEEEKWNT